MQTRRSISLVLLIALLVVTGVVWSMGAQEEGLKDGVYVGRAQGFGGEVVVDVTISGGRITAIAVRPHDETPFIAGPAIETLVAKMIETQSPEVEAVSGATYTSNALIAAVKQAVRKAEGFKDGVYTGTAEGFGGPLTVEVTVANGAIAKVVVLENSETPFIAEEAFKKLPEAIVANQSWDVDVVSGATYTSKAIIAAVEAALTE
ncbi:MAG TPA: FMN-binding protein [Limnochordia bacterium]|nr:FMN-binding protein [Limnochordia bacterium]